MKFYAQVGGVFISLQYMVTDGVVQYHGVSCSCEMDSLPFRSSCRESTCFFTTATRGIVTCYHYISCTHQDKYSQKSLLPLDHPDEKLVIAWVVYWQISQLLSLIHLSLVSRFYNNDLGHSELPAFHAATQLKLLCHLHTV